MDYSIFQQLGVSLVLATLVGLEREHRYQLYGYKSFGGIRTFALIGLLGTLAYFFFGIFNWMFLLITGGFFALLTSTYIMVARKSGVTGMTSEMAAILVYLNGVLCAMNQYLLAMAIALTLMVVLYFKDPLHDFAKHLKSRELVSTIQFLIIAFLILPILPNKWYGPYDFFNPYIIWLMVVFICGLSFLSYIAIKIFGTKKGIGVTGFLAGFISSTALALTFSGQSKKNPQIVNPYVVAVIIASSAMFFKVLIEVAILNMALVEVLLAPFLIMGVSGILSVIFFWFRKAKDEKKVEDSAIKLKSPFSLIPALKFALIFTSILFLSKFSASVVGDKGLYLTSFLSGLVDVDAIVVSIATLNKNEITPQVASVCITIAAITNTFVKALIFMLFGNRKVAIKISIALGLIMAVGVGLLFIQL